MTLCPSLIGWLSWWRRLSSIRGLAWLKGRLWAGAQGLSRSLGQHARSIAPKDISAGSKQNMAVSQELPAALPCAVLALYCILRGIVSWAFHNSGGGGQRGAWPAGRYCCSTKSLSATAQIEGIGLRSGARGFRPARARRLAVAGIRPLYALALCVLTRWRSCDARKD